MKNRGGKKENKRKQADQQGMFLGRIISGCRSDDKSTAFYKDCGPADIECVCEGRFGSCLCRAGPSAPAASAGPCGDRDTLPARRRSQGQRWTAGRALQTCRPSPHTVTVRVGQLPKGTSHLRLRVSGSAANPAVRPAARLRVCQQGQPATAASAQGRTNPRPSRAVPNWCESKVKFFLACIFGIRFQKQIELLVHG